jgi:hypothetical protein
MSLDQAYPTVAEVAPRAERGRLTGAAVVAAVVLAVDAVVLAGTLVLELPVLLRASDFEHRSETGIGVLAFTAVLTLACPAVAALVAGVRTRATYLAGIVTMAVVAVAVAGFTGLWLNLTASALTVAAGLVFAANLAALFQLTGLLRPADR